MRSLHVLASLSLVVGSLGAQGLSAPHALSKSPFETFELITSASDAGVTRFWVSGLGRYQVLQDGALEHQGSLSTEQLDLLAQWIPHWGLRQLGPTPPVLEGPVLTVKVVGGKKALAVKVDDAHTPTEIQRFAACVKSFQEALGDRRPAPSVPEGMRVQGGYVDVVGPHVQLVTARWAYRILQPAAAAELRALAGTYVELVCRLTPGPEVRETQRTCHVEQVAWPPRVVLQGELKGVAQLLQDGGPIELDPHNSPLLAGYMGQQVTLVGYRRANGVRVAGVLAQVQQPSSFAPGYLIFGEQAPLRVPEGAEVFLFDRRRERVGALWTGQLGWFSLDDARAVVTAGLTGRMGGR